MSIILFFRLKSDVGIISEEKPTLQIGFIANVILIVPQNQGTGSAKSTLISNQGTRSAKSTCPLIWHSDQKVLDIFSGKWMELCD